MKTTFILLLFGLLGSAFGNIIQKRTLSKTPADKRGFKRFGSEDDDCEVNEFDGPQSCHCGEGRKISWVTAEYDDHDHDRQYSFTCTGIPDNVGGFSGNTW